MARYLLIRVSTPYSKSEMTMKTLNRLTALTLVLAASLAFGQQAGNTNAVGAQAAPAYKAKSKKLDRAELDALLAKPDQVLIIDVRRPDELTKIGGFPAYLSIQSKDLEKSVDFIPKGRVIVTASNHAARALRGADLLASKGFKVAGAVGAQDYEAEGGTLVKISPPAPKAANAPATSTTQ